jgi:transcription initiation factor TFIIIB Brf1 subunit/transcription initiation factor TFIIB
MYLFSKNNGVDNKLKAFFQHQRGSLLHVAAVYIVSKRLSTYMHVVQIIHFKNVCDKRIKRFLNVLSKNGGYINTLQN